MDNDPEIGYKMGFIFVSVHLFIINSIKMQEISQSSDFQIQEYLEENQSAFILLGEGTQNQKKGQQLACEIAIQSVG